MKRTILFVGLLAASMTVAAGGNRHKSDPDCNGIANCNTTTASARASAHGGRATVGDTKAFVGDTKAVVGDTKAFVGDTKATVDDSGNSRVRVNAGSSNRATGGQGGSAVAHGGRGGEGGQGGRGGHGGSVGDVGMSSTTTVNGGDTNVRGGDVSADSYDNSSSTVTVDAADRSYHEAQRRNPVNTAYAAPLVAGDDTCMGSTSAGGQGITIGFSFSTTWKDEDCVVRKDARFLQNAQRQDIALSLMCSKGRVLDAVKRAGTDAEKRACGLEVPTTAPVAVPVPVTDPGERG